MVIVILSVGDMVDISLPITGKDSQKVKDRHFLQGKFLVTQIRHSFDQQERLHTMLMNVKRFNTNRI